MVAGYHIVLSLEGDTSIIHFDAVQRYHGQNASRRFAELSASSALHGSSLPSRSALALMAAQDVASIDFLPDCDSHSVLMQPPRSLPRIAARLSLRRTPRQCCDRRILTERRILAELFFLRAAAPPFSELPFSSSEMHTLADSCKTRSMLASLKTLLCSSSSIIL